MQDKFVGLIILDGFGLSDSSYGNAILSAKASGFAIPAKAFETIFIPAPL